MQPAISSDLRAKVRIDDLRAVGFLDVSNVDIVETRKTNLNSHINEVVINTLSCKTSFRKVDFFIIEEDGTRIKTCVINGKPVKFCLVFLKPVTPENYQEESLINCNRLAALVTEGTASYLLADYQWINNWKESKASMLCFEKNGAIKVFSTIKSDKQGNGVITRAEKGENITANYIIVRARISP